VTGEVVLSVDRDDSDQGERIRLSRDLRDALLKFDIETRSVEAGESPPGAKGTALEWAQLVVTGSATIAPVVGAAIAWVQRHKGAQVTVSIDGDSISIAETTDAQKQDLVKDWLRRHEHE
jgi:hypothetical protein